MTSRRAHQISILRDMDALHALVVANAALLLSGGLLFIVYFVHVWRVARRSAESPSLAEGCAVLLFGKRCANGQPDADFRMRIIRAHALARSGCAREFLLLGGGPTPTEAEVAARELRAAGLPDDVRLILEHDSRDTLQNLRNARDLLAARGEMRVILLSNRYHLARCAMFARNLGMPHQLCAAEPKLVWTSGTALRLLSETIYMLWVDIGTRWARLIGHQRMLAKIS